MARHGGNFSFPRPGRKLQKKKDRVDQAASNPSLHSAHEWPSRLDEPVSKAHRILGTSEPIYRSHSKQSSVSPTPGSMSITVSEASFASDLDDTASRAATDPDGYSTRPAVSRRASSNIMGHAVSPEGRPGSDYSVNSYRLHPHVSDSTMRTHYDAKSSPLAISQQTSDSAVRDRALRRGKPSVVGDYGYSVHVASPISPVVLEEAKKRENRKSKPAKLDLSRLFPRPKNSQRNQGLLSPAKMVNSPTAMSTTSDFPFPQPMTREPTPDSRGQVRLKASSRPCVAVPPIPSSPVRKFRPDEYDNAKVHVRRPPKGVQHWFDALDEDSDDAIDDRNHPAFAPKAAPPHVGPKIPIRQASAQQLHLNTVLASHGNRSTPVGHPHDTFTHDDLVDVSRITSPSQHSLVSNKTRGSTLSKSNLQDSSMLSFSSSDDEDEYVKPKASKVAVRKSLDMHYDPGEVVIGQAQALEVHSQRRPSTAQMSTRTWSTSAATIEVMYTPEAPFAPMHYPRYSHSSSRRSSHIRQPSVIHEDDDIRPKTAAKIPPSPSSRSVRSARTSTSEPKPRSEGKPKMMAVTAEEEMLLELMRKKRASMARRGLTHAEMFEEEQGKLLNKLSTTPVKATRKPVRTSGFLAEASPVRVVENKPFQKTATIPSPSHVAPRGRSRRAHYDSNRDSSTSDAWSEKSAGGHAALPPHLPAPSIFSPIDFHPAMSPIPTASVASPATTDHPSRLPSPMTPGVRSYEADVNVKVASSDTSTENEEVTVLDTGIIGAPLQRMKTTDSKGGVVSQHQRRRTASSGAEISFPAPPTNGPTKLARASERSSRPPSILEPSLPKSPRKNSQRADGLTLTTNFHSRSRQSSIHSAHSQLSGTSHSSSHLPSIEKRSSRRTSKTRNSVNDDVLAAWSSLGGAI